MNSEEKNMVFNNFNKLIIHPQFKDTIESINKLNIKLPQTPTPEEMEFSSYKDSLDGKLVRIEDKNKYKLNPGLGEIFLNTGIPVYAYDESIDKFSCLEGSAYLISHSIIIHGSNDFIPLNYITFNFYTKSKLYSERTNNIIKYSENAKVESERDYLEDRSNFIINNISNNPLIPSIIFIDGPLIGEQASSYTVKLNQKLLDNNIIPLFIVKNSNSSSITESFEEYRGKYNSDLDWAYKELNPGERTCLFKYQDEYNTTNVKVFCYIKCYNHTSPQRIELHMNTYKIYKSQLNDIINLIYYLILVQGNLSNPQVRTIAIAEQYAREVLKLFNMSQLMKNIGVIPTINQERFGR